MREKRACVRLWGSQASIMFPAKVETAAAGGETGAWQETACHLRTKYFASNAGLLCARANRTTREARGSESSGLVLMNTRPLSSHQRHEKDSSVRRSFQVDTPQSVLPCGTMQGAQALAGNAHRRIPKAPHSPKTACGAITTDLGVVTASLPLLSSSQRRT